MNCLLWIYGSPEFCSLMASKLQELDLFPKACIIESSQPKALEPLPWPSVPSFVRPLAFWKTAGFKSQIAAVLKQYPMLPVLFLAEAKNNGKKPLSIKGLEAHKLIQISPELRWPFGLHLVWTDPDAFLPTWEQALHCLEQKVIWP